MRLPDNGFRRAFALGLTIALAACGRGGDVDFAENRPAAVSDSAMVGASADYPVVLGEPYTVDGQLYTPEDSMNVDEVGYASLDVAGGDSVSIAHRTLPLPSYVEITSLDSGKTILARAERRGPMTSSRLAALSPGAMAQIGGRDGSAVRVRRVNPPEAERAALRSGRPATARLDTPMSLVEVLRERLPSSGSVSLASNEQPPVSSGIAGASVGGVQSVAVAPSTAELPPVAATSEMQPRDPSPMPAASELPAVAVAPSPAAPIAVSAPSPVAAAGSARFERAFGDTRRANTSYPLPPISGALVAPSAATLPRVAPPTPPPAAPVLVRGEAAQSFTLPATDAARAQPSRAVAIQPAPRAAPAAAPAETSTQGRFVIQAGAYSSQSNATRAADNIGGFVERSGRFYRVRTGPYATRGQAEAALAKVRAAGYNDARVFTAG